MKILLIDIGNSRIKWTFLVHQKTVEKKWFAWKPETLAESAGSQWADLDLPESVLISNVAGKDVAKVVSGWCEKIWQIKPFFARTAVQNCGVTNSYSEPEKLGIDRWLAMIAAWNLCKKNVCVIDCGSAVTIDVVDKDGIHKGGMISPGLALTGRALSEHTHALTAKQKQNSPLLADNTGDAISSGCYHQFIGGIQHVLEKIQEQFDFDMQYMITGGDAELVVSALELEMSHEPDLVLDGLSMLVRSDNPDSGRTK